MTTASDPTALRYTAAVLCGGHSTRMGTDKAWLPAPDSATNRPLLLRQLDLLGLLQPAPAERLVSARSGQPLPPLPATVGRLDDPGTHGPLGGLVNLLRHLSTPHLLVIPVDTPHLDPRSLQRLLDAARKCPDRSFVARSPHGVEPLVALYARSLAPLFAQAVADRHLGLRRLLTSATVGPHLDQVDFPTPDAFTNWNTPDDRR